MRTYLLVLWVLIAGCQSRPAEAVVAGPVKTTPRQLVADFMQADADGLALLDKYREGARFTGMLQTVDGDVILMNVDGKNVISLAFTDATEARRHAAGEVITVTCKIGGASGALMMVNDCVL